MPYCVYPWALSHFITSYYYLSLLIIVQTKKSQVCKVNKKEVYLYSVVVSHGHVRFEDPQRDSTAFIYHSGITNFGELEMKHSSATIPVQ